MDFWIETDKTHEQGTYSGERGPYPIGHSSNNVYVTSIKRIIENMKGVDQISEDYWEDVVTVIQFLTENAFKW